MEAQSVKRSGDGRGNGGAPALVRRATWALRGSLVLGRTVDRAAFQQRPAGTSAGAPPLARWWTGGTAAPSREMMSAARHASLRGDGVRVNESKRGATGTLLVALAAGGWGTWALFLRGHGLPPAWQSVMILSVIALAWLPAAVRASLRRAARSRMAWLLLGAAAVTDAGNYLCYFGALDRGPIALAVLTHYLAPVVVAVLAPALLREALTRRTVVALAVSLGGLALLVLGDGGLAAASGRTAALGAGSAVFYGLNTLLTKKLLDDFAASELLAWHCAGSAALVALFAGAPPPVSAFFWGPMAGALLLGALGAALFYAGLRAIPAQRAAVLTYLEPLVAALVGSFCFAEPLGRAGLAGGALIIAGGAAVALAGRREGSSGLRPQ